MKARGCYLSTGGRVSLFVEQALLHLLQLVKSMSTAQLLQVAMRFFSWFRVDNTSYL